MGLDTDNMENWSDEQIAELDTDLIVAATETEHDQDSDPEMEAELDASESAEESDTDTEDDDESEDIDDDSDAGDDLDSEESDEAADDASSDSDDQDDTDDNEEDTDQEDDDNSDIDYEAEHSKLLAPFKANGKDIQVRNVDEAIQLMQKGAGFEKKMQQLKPGLKTLKVLKNNDLLDPDKVSLMIDATKGNKAALTQLLKDNNINPLDLDTETEGDYQPNDHSVDDKELEFDDALERMRSSEHGNQVIKLVGTDWDDTSRNIVAQNPQILDVLDAHMGNGIYKQVIKEVERERVLGRLTGLSDLEAYKTVGDRMDRDGLLGTNPDSAPSPKRKTVGKKAPDKKVQAKKKAANPASQRNQNSSSDLGDDIYNLTDEEFEKRFG